jgi:hypothetical protein
MAACNLSYTGDGFSNGYSRKHAGVDAICCTSNAAGEQYGNTRKYAARGFITAASTSPA